MKKTFVKWFVLALLAGLLCVCCYYFGYVYGQWAQAAVTNEYVYEMARVDRDLTLQYKEDPSPWMPSPGNYVLELQSPRGVTKEDIIISAPASGPMMITSVIPAVSLDINGDTISWTGDTGYSGSEVYVGHIRKGVMSGNMYATGRGTIYRWILRPVKEEERGIIGK